MSAPDRRFERSMEYLARARRVVPGVSQTLSKAPSMFVEGAYPFSLERGQGCRVWDVDGNEYVDYVMGLASVTLGYAHPAVDAAVTRQLQRGSILSLPHPLEVEVSERLTRLIPCAEMVRFLKTGSEGNSAAIRVARAATGRDVIVYCGYSGWHDWYAITTPRSKGIPKDFSRLIVPFTYNDLPSLEAALEEHRGRVAAVIMEPVLLDAPNPGFLAGVKDAAHRAGALLIFDEIVSGFPTSPSSARGWRTGCRSPRWSVAESSCANSTRSSCPAPSAAIPWRWPHASPPSTRMRASASSTISGESASVSRRGSPRSPSGSVCPRGASGIPSTRRSSSITTRPRRSACS
jgi:glutamate-1-semialdehyde aminotransferase